MHRNARLTAACAALTLTLSACASDLSGTSMAGLPTTTSRVATPSQPVPSALSTLPVESTPRPSQAIPSPREAESSSAASSPVPSSSDPASPGPSSSDPSSSDPSSPVSSTPSRPSGATSTSVSTTTPAPSPARPPAILKRGNTGDKVRELQHRLLQLDWFSGKITPDYGNATEAGVQGFQGKRGLMVTGEVDQRTWDLLVSMTRTPTHDDMFNVLKHGPRLLGSGDTGPRVREVQARLRQLGWYEKAVDGTFGAQTVAAVKGFQGKRQIPATGEVDQRTLDALLAMTSTPTPEELANKPPKKQAPPTVDQRCMTGRVICISKSNNQLAWVVDGTVKQTLDVRFGSELTPTREGVFTLYWKSRDHVSTLYDTPMPWAMFFSGGQAVHYSADFAARGYNGASHGCVNVRDRAGIQRLFDQTREGDKVIVYR